MEAAVSASLSESKRRCVRRCSSVLSTATNRYVCEAVSPAVEGMGRDTMNDDE